MPAKSKKPPFKVTVRLPKDVHYAAKVAALTHTNQTVQDFISESIRARLRALGLESLLKAPKLKRIS